MPMNPRLLRPTQGGFVSPDADARAYLAAVRQADGANLEPAVAKAISDFVIGCKADGIWDAIKASCILAGARTLSGALTPLKGSAPTNNNFVSGDYNRETGLKGDGSTKFINSNRAANADPLDDEHMAVYASQYNAAQTRALIGYGRSLVSHASLTNFSSRSRNTTTSSSVAAVSNGLVGVSRNSDSSYVFRSPGASQTFNTASSTAFVDGDNRSVFGTGGANFSGSIAFYSIGESLDLAALDTRVSALITAIAAAI